MDQHYLQGNKPAFTTIAKSQRSYIKDLCSNNNKLKNFNPGMGLGLCSQRANNESSAKSKKQKWSSNKKSNFFAFGTNTIKAGTGQKLKKQKRDVWRSSKKDISKVIYYKCNKKNHYANQYPKPPKAEN